MARSISELRGQIDHLTVAVDPGLEGEELMRLHGSALLKRAVHEPLAGIGLRAHAFEDFLKTAGARGLRGGRSRRA